MSIVYLMKTEMSVRVTCGDRWMIWTGERWEVFERKPHQKKTRLLISTEHEGRAVEKLSEES